MNNYNYAYQSPVSVNHSLEHRDVDDINGEFNETDPSGSNKLDIESDKRSPSSATIEPQVSSTLNNLSPSPRDSPILSDSNQDEFLYNHSFDLEKRESNNGNDNLLDLTPDQVQVFKELELRKQEVDYDEEYDFNYDDIPEYDVRAKIQSLNAQLADEPFPPDAAHRNSKVVFKDDIVSLVIPADNDGQSESELDDPSQSQVEIESEQTYSSQHLLTDNESHRQDKSNNKPIDSDFNKDEEIEVKDEENEIKQEEIGNKPEEIEIKSEELELQPRESLVKTNTMPLEENMEQDDMVVSRGGKFHVMGAGDIIDGSNHNPKDEDDKSSSNYEPKRAKNRPASASVAKSRNKEHAPNSDTGSTTISDLNSRSNSLLQKPNDKSKLEIPRVDKSALRRQQERKKKEEEENLKREEEEQRVRREMNEQSYNAWLLIKQKQRKEEDDRKKKEEEEEREKKEKLQDERKMIAEEKEKELAKKLDNERKREEKLRQYRLKEMEDSMTIHSKAECKKAYKDWLKKKHKDHQNKVKEDRQRARVTRLAMRQCRKSQDLAQAIQQSSSFRYLDFCGYP